MCQRQLRQGIAAFSGIMILILDSRTVLEGAAKGMELCIRSLIPSLFPFIVLSTLLTKSFLGTVLPPLRPIGRLMCIPEGCESLLIPGFLGGYPSGAQSIGQAYAHGSLSRTDAQRLLLFCSNAGPSFLFGVLGPVFPQKWMLWLIWGIQIAGAWLCARILPVSDEQNSVCAENDASLPKALSSAVQTMAYVCGWVILFRVITAFLERWFLWLLPNSLRILVAGILELSNGCCSLTAIDDLRTRFVLACGMLSFGGICVTMQTASVIDSLSLLPYVLSKLLQSLFCLALAAALAYKAVWLLPVIAVLCFCLKKGVEFSGFLVYNENINSRRNRYAVSKKDGACLRLLSARYAVGGRHDPLRKEGSANSR